MSNKIRKDKFVAIRVTAMEYEAISKVASIEVTTVSEIVRRAMREMAKQYDVWPPIGDFNHELRNTKAR